MNFEKVIKLPQETLKRALKKELRGLGYNPVNGKGFLYAQGSVPVMLVAHLDTVHKTPVQDICKSPTGIWMSPQGIGGDDRCGVFAILQIIRKSKCHVLFTEDEEVGCIGAKAFCKANINPKINYIVEIDRKGDNDSVFYNCDNKDFETFVNGFGFKTAYGSCSDISHVAPALKVAAVNLSSGYFNPHRTEEHIDLNVLWNTINRVCKMVNTPTKKYEWVEKKYTPTYGSGATYYGNNAGYYDTWTYSWPSKENLSGKDIIWLHGTDYILRITTNGGYVASPRAYGIDKDGNFWFYYTGARVPDSLAKSIHIYDELGNECSPKDVYLFEKLVQEELERSNK